MQVTRERSAEQAAGDIADLLGGEAPDVCIECSGAEPSIRSVSSVLIYSVSVSVISPHIKCQCQCHQSSYSTIQAKQCSESGMKELET